MVHRQIIFLCARSPFDPRRELTVRGLAELLPEINDSSAFLEVIRVERMIPLVRLWLRSVRREFPEATASLKDLFWTQLEALYQRVVAYNLHVIDGWRPTQALLMDAGIRAIPVKGPALSALAYDDAALRQVEDLDVIIFADDLPEAARILTAAGYRQVGGPTDSARHAAYAASLQDWLFEDAHHRLLDIKPVPISHRIARPEDVARVQARLAPLAMDLSGGLVWQAPDRIAMTLLACMHGVEEGWPSLRNAADVAALVCRLTPDEWPELIDAAAQWRQKNTLLFALALCHRLELLPADIEAFVSLAPPGGTRKLLEQTVARLRSDKRIVVSPLAASRYAILLRDDMGGKIRCIWRQATVPSMRDWECLPKNGSAWALLPIRFVRLFQHVKK